MLCRSELKIEITVEIIEIRNNFTVKIPGGQGWRER